MRLRDFVFSKFDNKKNMDNPVNTVKDAAKSALTIKNVLILFFGLLALCAILDMAGLTNAVFQPVTSIKAWQKKRAEKAKTA